MKCAVFVLSVIYLTITTIHVNVLFILYQENPLREKLWSPDDDIRVNATITEIGNFVRL